MEDIFAMSADRQSRPTGRSTKRKELRPAITTNTPARGRELHLCRGLVVLGEWLHFNGHCLYRMQTLQGKGAASLREPLARTSDTLASNNCGKDYRSPRHTDLLSANIDA